ncbi:MAG: hypothetical protein WBE26_14695 [Phycisphaerae bacterium]
MAPLIAAFVVEFPKKIRAIEEVVVANDRAQLEALMRAMRAAGTSYGYEVITEAASKVENALIDGVEMEEVATTWNSW